MKKFHQAPFVGKEVLDEQPHIHVNKPRDKQAWNFATEQLVYTTYPESIRNPKSSHPHPPPG